MQTNESEVLSFDIPGIQSCQRNRYPMLFIDRITECVPLKYAKGYKLFSYDEWYFAGYFPDDPNVPGAILVESLTQVFLMTFLCVGEAKGSLAMSNKFQNIIFYSRVLPGDRLDISAACTGFRRGIAQGKVEGFVNGKLAISLDVTIVVPKLFEVFQRGGNEAAPKPGVAETVPDAGLCFDIEGIKRCMKNRYPWLYLDRAVDVRPMESAIGVKNFTYNEWFFPPHFPDDPSVPGFIQIEAGLQAILMTFLCNAEYQGLATADRTISNVKLPRKIVPGDILKLDAGLDSFSRGIAKGRVIGTVNGEPSISFEAAVIIDELAKFTPKPKERISE
jgi:3-hydroxyacyl-[acyl-carrier-protein] dehydratase